MGGQQFFFPLVHSGLNSESFCVLQVWVLLNTKQWLGGLSTRMCLITFSRTSKWYVSPLKELSFCEFVSWCYGSLLTHVWISEIYCPVDKPFNIEMVVCSQKSGLVSNVAFCVSVFMLFGFPGCSSKCGFFRWQSSLGLWESVQQRFCLVLTWVSWVVVVACEQQAAGSDTKEGVFFLCLWEREDPFYRLLLLNLNKVFSWGRFIFWR
jgi:hypothetical protein